MYFNTDKQCYEAFGLSAYYADMAASPDLSFSHELQSMTILDHRPYDFYTFRTRSLIGSAGYERWKQGIPGNKG